MKLLYALFLLLFFSGLSADEWKIKSISFQNENDADIRDDAAYSYGASLSMLYAREDVNNSILHIPFTNYKESDNYISFSFAHQLYTPEDFENPDLVVEDRPYAGYMYLQSGLYQSYNKKLKSLTMQVGLVGPSSGMEGIQKLIHSLIGSPDPQGWEHQLNDELICQVNYSEMFYYKYFIPEYGFELGNASTKAYLSALFRWGKNVPKDYGAYVINNTNYSKISLDSDKKYAGKKWRLYLNLSLKTNIIARNIFLDGNTFSESHSVEKNNFTVDVGYGLSFAYKNFSIDYLRRHSSKEFKTQSKLYSYGSLLFSYSY